MRRPRIKKKDAKYHITARINRGEMILKDREIKNLFLSIVARAKKKYSFIFRGFCIMDNHPHMTIQTLGDTDLSKVMQWILSTFAITYNKKFGLKGHVFYDRFKSKVIETEDQYLNTLFYIYNNPVRVGLVDHPLQYEFSSIVYHRNEQPPWWLDPLEDWTTPWIDKFLGNYDEVLYKNVVMEYSFRDKKPGRPIKK